MADLSLNILVIPTYNTLTLGIADASTYPDSPPVESPSLTVEIPGGFDTITIPFVPNDFNILNSTILGITDETDTLLALPDGVYTLTYSVSPAYVNYVTKTFMRTEKLQERLDEAFMKLDMMECDKYLRKQAQVDLTTIDFFKNGAIAAANNCAVTEANKLYNQATKMLDWFINNNCGCSGNNYVNNF